VIGSASGRYGTSTKQGVRVARNPTQVAEIAVEILGARV
jgi:hypothetical protein